MNMRRRHRIRKASNLKEQRRLIKEERELAGGMKGKMPKDEPYWAREDWGLIDEAPPSDD